jgi:hypothetical protein
MKKITLLLLTLTMAMSTYAIGDGTYSLANVPFTNFITFDNTAEKVTITMTDATLVTNGYLAIGFGHTGASGGGGMNGTYTIFAVKTASGFDLFEYVLGFGNIGTLSAASPSLVVDSFTATSVTISRNYNSSIATAYDFNITDVDVMYAGAKGISFNRHSDRGFGTIGLALNTDLPELLGLNLYNVFSENSIEVKFPETAFGIYEVEIINSVGQTLVLKKLDSSVAVHSFSELSGDAPGIYFVRLRKEGKVLTYKVIKN